MKEKKLKRPTDTLVIDCELGLNNLYLPMDKKHMKGNTDKDVFPCVLRIDKKDIKTMNKVIAKFKEIANYAVKNGKTDKSAVELLTDTSKNKLRDGDGEKYESYENEHGKKLLQTVCYNDRPATGKIKGDKVIPERLGKKEGKEKGYIQRGDKVKAVLNFYHIKTNFHDLLMVRLISLFLLERGSEMLVSTDFESRLERASKAIGLKIEEEEETVEVGPENADVQSEDPEGKIEQDEADWAKQGENAIEEQEKKVKGIVKKETKETKEVDLDGIFG